MAMHFLRRKLRGLFGTPTPVRPGHRYVDNITGERIDVISVGTLVEIERLDADEQPHNNVPTEDVRRAIELDFLVHDDELCPECTE